MSELILDGHKLAWHKERVESWLRGERIAPITIDWAMTRKCTYKCVYCYGMLQENERKVITRDVAFRFLDDAAEIGVKAVSFISDGESTCSPYFMDAVLHGKANGLDIGVATNGYLLDADRLEELLDAVTYLRFNISAGEPHRYAEIHGCTEKCFHKVSDTIKKAVGIKRNRGLDVTIGTQMVLLPEFQDQVLPLAKLGKELGVDYLVIKHCSDDEFGTIGVQYDKYDALTSILKDAEAMSDAGYAVRAKWSKIMSNGKRLYDKCYGPPFMIQLSGSGLVAPCGMLFNDRYKGKFHIGNIVDTSFKELWQSDRYWEVMDRIASDSFDVDTMCGCLCLQHKINEYLWSVKREGVAPQPIGSRPLHHNFI
jgi:MoaA/NifB/PqqE/SkfB family radical SAM enzyme